MGRTIGSKNKKEKDEAKVQKRRAYEKLYKNKNAVRRKTKAAIKRADNTNKNFIIFKGVVNQEGVLNMLLKGPRRYYSLGQGRFWSKIDNKGFTQCFNDTLVHNGHGKTMKEFVNVVAEALEITGGGYTPTVIKQDNTCKVPNPDPVVII